MILITGGLGFIGSHVCRECVNQGEEVVVIDNIDEDRFRIIKKTRIPDLADKIRIEHGDITDFPFVLRTMKKYGVTRVVHTAAITFIPKAVENPSLTFNVNVIGTFNLLEAARLLDVKKFVYISSASVYGDFRAGKIDENHPIEPKEIYGASKAAADRLSIAYYRTYGLPVTIIRTTSVYGPGDLEDRVVKRFIENALTGKPLELYGGGLQRRDFSYVKDVAHGIILALGNKQAVGEVFHISGGRDYAIKDVAEVVKKYIPRCSIVEKPSRRVDVKRGCLDITKAMKVLGYRPRYDLDRGVREYIKWMVEVYVPAFGLEVKNKPVI